LLEGLHCEDGQDAGADDAKNLEGAECEVDIDACVEAGRVIPAIAAVSIPEVVLAEHGGSGQKQDAEDEQVDSKNDLKDGQVLAKLFAEHGVQQVEHNVEEQHGLKPGEDQSRNVSVIDRLYIVECVAGAEGAQDELEDVVAVGYQLLCIVL
jgi:hypothetical protein